MPLQPPHPLTRTPAPVQVQEQRVEEEGCRRAEPTQDRQNSKGEGVREILSWMTMKVAFLTPFTGPRDQRVE